MKPKNAPAFTVFLPLPPKECSPNARSHWAAKARAVKKYRTVARIFSSVAWGGYPPMAKADAQIVFYYHQRRVRDLDNLLASAKAGFDGIADAGVVVNDSVITYLPVSIEIVGKDIEEGVRIRLFRVDRVIQPKQARTKPPLVEPACPVSRR